MKRYSIDLNCDMGESFGNYAIGNDDRILPYITSCNVACGFHGGDPVQIEKTIKKALAYGVQIGAHPGYPDLQGFGRRRMQIPVDELRAIVKYQIAAVKGITESLGGKLSYVKPHGALYNTAADESVVAQAIALAIREVSEEIALMGLAGSLTMKEAANAHNLRFIAEAFADRRYTINGRLQSRSVEGAVIHDPQSASNQVISIVKHKGVESNNNTFIELKAQSICIHGDNPKVETILMAIDKELEIHNIKKECF